MSSDSDCAAAILLAIAIKRKKKRRRKIWCKELYKKRVILGKTVLLKELEFTSGNDFKTHVRMKKNTFNELLSIIRHRIEKKDTMMREAIPSHHRLSITLRYLASGICFEDLKLLTAISPQSICRIIIDTCEAILSELKDYIKLPQTQDEWKKEARHFNYLWNFPHCLGAINGTHINIMKPTGSGSMYLNYKKEFSIMLMAIVNSNYEFIMVDVGPNRTASVAGLFNNTKFFSSLKSKTLDIPDPEPLPGSEGNVPFVFVADESFQLLKTVMKPFSQNTLKNNEIIFNNRLSRAHRIGEHAFGILTSNFKILQKTLNLAPPKITLIALACCHLHNFLLAKNESAYFDGEYIESNNESHRVNLNSHNLQSLHVSNETKMAKNVREKFCQYFKMVGEDP